MNEGNPYASPAESADGQYDWSLWRSFMRAVAVIVLCFLVIDAAAIARYAKVANPDRPVATVVWGFFADWKTGAMPTWPEREQQAKEAVQ